VLLKTGRFRRADRILRTQDFKRVVKSGKRRVSGSFVVVTAQEISADARKSGENRRRLGATVSKRVGNAVVRNRVKRCIREWFRHSRAGLPGQSEIVVIARRAARDLSGTEIAEFLDRATQNPEDRGSRQVAVGLQ
jgi:ribonuclease P protein component